MRGALCNHTHCMIWKLTECRVHCVSARRWSANSHGTDRHERHAAITRTGAEGGEGGRGGRARSFLSYAPTLHGAEKGISTQNGKIAYVLLVFSAKGPARCDTFGEVVVPRPMRIEK